MYFATYIIGQTPFPEFTVVGMLDDVQVRYYDSVTQRAVSHSHNDTKHYDEEQTDDIVIFRDMYYNLKDRAYYLKDNLNLSDGEFPVYILKLYCLKISLKVWKKKKKEYSMYKNRTMKLKQWSI